MKKTLALTILLAAFASCSDSDTYQDIEKPIDTGTPPTNPTDPTTPTAFTYNKNVKAIIDASCAGCHSSSGSASFRPLTTYAQVKTAVESAGLLTRIKLQNGQQGLMPQGGRMSQTNIDAIVKWNTDGLKEN